MKPWKGTVRLQKCARSNSGIRRFNRGLWIGRCVLQQHPRRTGGPRTALLPVLQCAQIHANEPGELRLADLCGFADRAHIGLQKLESSSRQALLRLTCAGSSAAPP